MTSILEAHLSSSSLCFPLYNFTWYQSYKTLNPQLAPHFSILLWFVDSNHQQIESESIYRFLCLLFFWLVGLIFQSIYPQLLRILEPNLLHGWFLISIMIDSVNSDSRNTIGSRQIHEGYNNDPLFLQNSDYPTMQLFSNKLNGANLQRSSRYVKIALRTKVKLGFIDGSYTKPDPNSPNYSQWINSIVPELADAFFMLIRLVNFGMNSLNDLVRELVHYFIKFKRN